eukprot:8004271-Alexandrium_andersonii.AAC.1
MFEGCRPNGKKRGQITSLEKHAHVCSCHLHALIQYTMKHCHLVFPLGSSTFAGLRNALRGLGTATFK